MTKGSAGAGESAARFQMSGSGAQHSGYRNAPANSPEGPTITDLHGHVRVWECVCVHGEAKEQKVILISLQLANVCEGQTALVIIIIIIFLKKINILDRGSLVRSSLLILWDSDSRVCVCLCEAMDRAELNPLFMMG